MRSMACSSGQTPQRERRENCCVICMESKTLSRIRKKSDSLRGQHETVLLCWFRQGLLWVLVYICIILYIFQVLNNTIQYIQCTYFTVISYIFVTLSSQWRWRVSRTALLSVTRGWQSDQPWQVWAVFSYLYNTLQVEAGEQGTEFARSVSECLFQQHMQFQQRWGGKMFRRHGLFFVADTICCWSVIYHWNDTIHLWEW